MEFITSRSNPLIIDTAKLADKKYRDLTGLFLIEGVKLFFEAHNCGVEIENVFVTQSFFEKYQASLPEYRYILVSDGVFEKLSSEKSPQGIICTAKRLDFLHKYNKIYNSAVFSPPDDGKILRYFIASSIQDAGNLGTIIRSADALGVDVLLLDSHCADLYHNRTIRAAMGALFRQRIAVCSDICGSIKTLISYGYNVYAAALDRRAVKLNEQLGGAKHTTCYVIGNEGHGLSTDIISECTGCVFIPMSENSESLNAAVAAGILMWECYR